jgi:hypothetical protein
MFKTVTKNSQNKRLLEDEDGLQFIFSTSNENLYAKRKTRVLLVLGASLLYPPLYVYSIWLKISFNEKKLIIFIDKKLNMTKQASRGNPSPSGDK